MNRVFYINNSEEKGVSIWNLNSNSECKQSKDFPQDCNSWMDAMMAINFICRNLQNNFIKYK